MTPKTQLILISILPVPMNVFLRQLKGGDRRSIGAVQQVVKQVMADPALFPVVFSGMTDSDPLIRMRCSDAVEKITACRPEYLRPYHRRLIRLAGAAQQQEVRWHFAQLLSRLELNKSDRRRVAQILYSYLTDTSKIVKTFSMQALADIALQDRELHGPIVEQLEKLTRTGSPAMQSRGRKLLMRLREPLDNTYENSLSQEKKIHFRTGEGKRGRTLHKPQ